VRRHFASSQLKIDRANHHISDFDARRNIFLKHNPCKLRPQYDPQTDYTEYIVEDVAEIDPVMSLVIGDAIHNLRSALDHLAAALVRDNGNSPVRTYFPICKSASLYIDDAPGQVKGMSVADENRIGGMKPYLGGDDRFWGLHRMDITDKHDLILTHTQCVPGINYTLNRASDITVALFGTVPSSTQKETVMIPLLGAPLIPKKGEVLLHFSGNTEKNEDMTPSFDIAFGDVEVFKGRLVSEVLHDLATLVQGTINVFV
jgi:hypothetical protein